MHKGFFSGVADAPMSISIKERTMDAGAISDFRFLPGTVTLITTF
jgi:hypothetical protein